MAGCSRGGAQVREDRTGDLESRAGPLGSRGASGGGLGLRCRRPAEKSSSRAHERSALAGLET